MDFRDIAIAVGGGAMKGYLNDQAAQNENERVQKEEQRKAQLLQQKEAMKQRSEIYMQQMKQQNAIELEGIKQQGGMTKLDKTHEYNKEIEGIKSKNNLEIEGVKAKNKATGKDADDDYSTADILKMKNTLRKEYASAKKGSNSALSDEEFPSFEDWAGENYPEQYATAYGKSAAKKTNLSGFDAFKSAALSRVKQGANSELPMAVGH
jgi:hypothetical protein